MDDLHDCPDCATGMDPIPHRGGIAWRCPACGRALLPAQLTAAG